MLSDHWHDSLNLVDDGRGGRLAWDDMPVNVRTVGWPEGAFLRFTRDTTTGRGHDDSASREHLTSQHVDALMVDGADSPLRVSSNFADFVRNL